MIKTLSALAAAGTLAIAVVAAPAPAQASDKAGAVAAGVIGGLAAGAIFGSAVHPYGYRSYGYGPGPVYYGSPYGYAPRCYTVRQRVWTDRGPRLRRVRVCD
jgi:hypothetical protein